MELTPKGSRFVCTECIVLLWEESACGAGPRVAKQAGWCAAGGPKTKASAGRGSGRLAECTGPKKSPCETGTRTKPSWISHRWLLLAQISSIQTLGLCTYNEYRQTINDKPGLFCVEPNSPPVLVVVPNADVPKPPVVPNPVSVATAYVWKRCISSI